MTDTSDRSDFNDRCRLPLAPLEKTALETYVPPAKPSLIGLSRAEIAERLGDIGVAPAQRKMRIAAALALDLCPRREERSTR